MAVKHVKVATFPDQVGVEINKAEWNDSHVIEPNTIGDLETAIFTTTKISTLAKTLLNVNIAYKDEINWLTDAMVLAHTTTKITTTSKALLNSALAYNDQTNAFGDFEQSFKDNQLKIFNPADTFKYTIVAAAIAAARNLNLPLLTADDTIAVLNMPQTLASKILTRPRIVDTGSIDDDTGNEYLRFLKIASAVNEISVKNAATGVYPEIQASGGDTNIGIKLVPKGTGVIFGNLETIMIAISDETSVITTGTNKVKFRMPYAFKVVKVKASLTTASSSGLPTFDINEAGVSIISTKITIDANELTSETAATPPVISDADLADDAEISIDIDVAGTGAVGAKVYILGYATAKPA